MTSSPVFVSSYRRHEVCLNQSMSLRHVLARRMTPLQRASLEALELWRQSNEKGFDLVFKEWASPLYFASAYGELSAYLKEAELINENSLPVSPLAFQHSVQNCTPGYFSILNGFRTPHLTFASGVLSLEKALYFAWNKISKGTLKCVCVLSANETGSPTRILQSSAEMLILYGGNQCTALPPTHVLENFQLSWSATDQIQLRSPESVYPELFADIFSGKEKREITSRIGERYTSTWRTL